MSSKAKAKAATKRESFNAVAIPGMKVNFDKGGGALDDGVIVEAGAYGCSVRCDDDGKVYAVTYSDGSILAYLAGPTSEQAN